MRGLWAFSFKVLSWFYLCFSIAKGDLSTKLPLVGVVLQPGSYSLRYQLPNPIEFYTYVPGSYLDWAGLTGAMPIFLPFDLDQANMDYMLDKVDMVLIPGGGSLLMNNDGSFSPYMKALQFILDKAKTINDNGRYFPVYGTCNGFEALVIYWAQDTKILTCDFDDLHKEHIVNYQQSVLEKSKLWNDLDQTNLEYVFNNGYVLYDHNCGFTPDAFNKSDAFKKGFVVGTSTADNGKEFVSIVEDKKYPFFASQFHPEKNQFERVEVNSFLDKSTETISFLSQIIQTLVDRVRSNASSYNNIPETLLPYFSTLHTPLLTYWTHFERMYVMNRVVPLKPSKDYQKAYTNLPVVDGLPVTLEDVRTLLGEAQSQKLITLLGSKQTYHEAIKLVLKAQALKYPSREDPEQQPQTDL